MDEKEAVEKAEMKRNRILALSAFFLSTISVGLYLWYRFGDFRHALIPLALFFLVVAIAFASAGHKFE